MSKSTTVHKYGLTPIANSRCQSLPQSTSMGSHPLLMVDVKVYYSQRVWIRTFCQLWMSKSTIVNEYWFTPFANGRFKSLLQSTSMGSHPLLMVDVSLLQSKRMGALPLLMVDVSLLQSTSMGAHPLLMVDGKVYYSQRVWVHTLC